jgi:hypothetical protein
MTGRQDGDASDWKSALQMKFVAERTRAVPDLLAGVPFTAARRVADLGCGPECSAPPASARCSSPRRSATAWRLTTVRAG